MQLRLLEDFARRVPATEELLARIDRNFSGRDVPKSERPVPLDLELLLAEDQDDRELTLHLPILLSCTACHGQGRLWAAPCPECDGLGLVRGDAELEVWVEPDSVQERPLEDLGIENLYLHLRTRMLQAMGPL